MITAFFLKGYVLFNKIIQQ